MRDHEGLPDDPFWVNLDSIMVDSVPMVCLWSDFQVQMNTKTGLMRYKQKNLEQKWTDGLPPFPTSMRGEVTS